MTKTKPSSSTTNPQHKPFQVSNWNFTERSLLFKNVSTRRVLSKVQRNTETPIKKLHLKRRCEDATSGNKPSLTSDNSRRKKVKTTLGNFRALCAKLGKELTADGLPIEVSRILKNRGKFIHDGKKIIGKVSGIEVGDKFLYWQELNVLGLHRQNLSLIDHVLKDGNLIATSVVSCHFDDMDDTNVFVYTGEGGNVINSGKCDEETLALMNSYHFKNAIRVIIKFNSKNCGAGARGGGEVYCYYGLYKVESIWKKKGKLDFKFCLVRLPDQKIFVKDISNGKEAVPICVVNHIDSGKVPYFQYITRNIYPEWLFDDSSVGRKCVDHCSDSMKCSCALKSGGKITRVKRNEIKFKLQIFKTKAKGWGVRSENAIPSGNFICEYLGEIMEDEEALKKVDNDEYLFNIGNYIRKVYSSWEEDSYMVDSKEMTSYQPLEASGGKEVVDDRCDSGRFTIDAAKYGNVARFINHSCSPNLFARNVLYDDDDLRIPHIMLYAAENIPSMNELTLSYNYKIDQVIDSNGNLKTKACYCGASECIRRLY
ncbi:putative histone-lysine N-methyltransferase chromatin remodeling SET family [Medicago truncatula]|uniref:Putative histone-lysine N-methyltransferase chromatin remodeling SET family n=1 Tax=Medicago truncatula TaxID=3880 RepID=A0A396H1J2_MEDTR|nr:histone-lysine N-methyltransferase, H3 lysine-9 specific SUVH5 [Medicago truncatula]RHN45574.1 putative histone-lysine N-methyltransferase chromatin remodeling SET family [Medicago truncatula]